MRFEGRFRKIEYKPRSPIYLVILLVFIIAIMIFLRFYRGG
jgi:hypothetical protein